MEKVTKRLITLVTGILAAAAGIFLFVDVEDAEVPPVGNPVETRQEIVSERTYSTRTFDEGNGKKTLQTHGGHIHYMDESGNLVPSVVEFVDVGTHFEMMQHNYTLEVHKNFGANNLIRYTNKYDGADHTILYEPKVLAWVNRTNLTDRQIFRNAQSVQGVLTNNNTVVRYTNAFGDGIHFEITLRGDGFKKEIVIDAKNKLELPPTNRHKLVAFFRYTGDGLKILKEDRQEWNQDAYFENEGGFIAEELGGRSSIIQPAFIYDMGTDVIDDPLGHYKPIKVFWKKHDNALWQGKVLDKQFLANAIYPVRADTTTSYYPAANTDDGQDYEGLLYRTTDTAIITGGDGTYQLNASYRFTSIDIAQGTTIDSAYIKVYTQAASQEGAPIWYIDGDDVDNSTTAQRPSSGATYTPTTASVAWTGMGSAQNTWYTSPDVKTVVQEIINRAGWSSGNAMNLALQNNGGTSRKFRRYMSYNNGSNYEYLEITYTAAAAARRVIITQ